MRVEVRAREPPAAVAAPSRPPAAARCPEPSALQLLRSRGRLRGTLALLGPAFVACVAYVDPGNFATNIAGGAKYGYLLLWVMLAANLMAMLIQNLSAKVGIATGRNLPELCREHFPRPVDLGPVGPGRAHRDGHRPRRVRRRRDRAEPALRRPALRRRADHRRRRLRRSSACRPRATGASRSPSPACSASSSSASSTTRCASASTPGAAARGFIPGFDGHRQRAAGHRHPRRDGHAARHLPALGAHAGPDPAARRRRAPAAAALRAHRRRDRDGPRRPREHVDADHRRLALPRQRAGRASTRSRRPTRASGRWSAAAPRSPSRSRCSPRASRPRASGPTPARSSCRASSPARSRSSLRRAVTMTPALDRARARPRPDALARHQPGRAELRHPVRARAARAADPPARRHGRAGQPRASRRGRRRSSRR